MQTFAVINENLIFRNGTVLFSFFIPNCKNKYLLYYISDLENDEKKLLISQLVNANGFSHIVNIDEDDFDKIKSYIIDFINGNGGKKEIKISRKTINFEPNICQTIIESDRGIVCDNIENIEFALKTIKKDYLDCFVYINELNNAIYNCIVSKNKKENDIYVKESIKGNVNVFLLTLFAVIFLSVLIFMGYGELINH